MSNAVKFTKEGGQIRIRVAFDALEESLRIEVDDSGIGIED
jgi:signal transduction histidine kinase